MRDNRRGIRLDEGETEAVIDSRDMFDRDGLLALRYEEKGRTRSPEIG